MSGKNGQIEHQQHYQVWIALLTTLAHESSQELLAGYRQKLECTEKNKALCNQAFRHHADHISQPISEVGSWHKKLLLAEQIASYLDHPYYPTARAKFGLSDEDLAK